MEYDKAEEKFRFFVKEWLDMAKICRACGTRMNAVGGGQLADKKGNYAKEGEDYRSYSEYRCPHCKRTLREETTHKWS